MLTRMSFLTLSGLFSKDLKCSTHVSWEIGFCLCCFSSSENLLNISQKALGLELFRPSKVFQRFDSLSFLAFLT